MRFEHDEEKKVSYREVTTDELSRMYELDICHKLNKPYAEESVLETNLKSQGAKWYGGLTSTAEVKSILAEGWKEGVTKMAEVKSQVAHGLGAKTRKRCLTWGESGDDLNVDKAMRGDWDTAYRRSVRKWAPGLTHVDLVCAWGGNAGVRAEEMFWQGAQMAILADLLEEAGYAVCLRALASTGVYSNGGLCANAVIVKEYDEPLRLDAIAGVFAHAGIFRTVGFALLQGSPFDLGSGIGHHTDLPDAMKRYAGVPFGNLITEDPDTIVVADAFNKETAVEHILEVIQKVGASSD